MADLPPEIKQAAVDSRATVRMLWQDRWAKVLGIIVSIVAIITFLWQPVAALLNMDQKVNSLTGTVATHGKRIDDVEKTSKSTNDTVIEVRNDVKWLVRDRKYSK